MNHSGIGSHRLPLLESKSLRSYSRAPIDGRCEKCNENTLVTHIYTHTHTLYYQFDSYVVRVHAMRRLEMSDLALK